MLDSSFADGPELVKITKVTNAESSLFWPSDGDPQAAAAADLTESDILKKGQARASYSSGAIAGYLDGNQKLLRVEAAAEYRALERMHRGMSLRYRAGLWARWAVRFVGAFLILYHLAEWAWGS
jgi:hypothetical protein